MLSYETTSRRLYSGIFSISSVTVSVVLAHFSKVSICEKFPKWVFLNKKYKLHGSLNIKIKVKLTCASGWFCTNGK